MNKFALLVLVLVLVLFPSVSAFAQTQTILTKGGDCNNCHQKASVIGGTCVQSEFSLTCIYIPPEVNGQAVCTVDADCPTGSVCMDGTCVQKALPGTETLVIKDEGLTAGEILGISGLALAATTGAALLILDQQGVFVADYVDYAPQGNQVIHYDTGSKQLTWATYTGATLLGAAVVGGVTWIIVEALDDD